MSTSTFLEIESTMKTPLRLSLLSLLAFALATAMNHGTSAADKPETDPRIVKLFGENGANNAANADIQRAYRISDAKREGDKRIDGYKVVSGPEEIEAKTWAGLRTLLLDPNIYDWDLAAGCEFQPGVAVSLDRASTRATAMPVDVLFCFNCDELQVWYGGKRVGMANFSNHRALFVRAMKQIFPKDPEIQKLEILK